MWTQLKICRVNCNDVVLTPVGRRILAQRLHSTKVKVDPFRGPPLPFDACAGSTDTTHACLYMFAIIRARIYTPRSGFFADLVVVFMYNAFSLIHIAESFSTREIDCSGLPFVQQLKLIRMSREIDRSGLPTASQLQLIRMSREIDSSGLLTAQQRKSIRMPREIDCSDLPTAQKLK